MRRTLGLVLVLVLAVGVIADAQRIRLPMRKKQAAAGPLTSIAWTHESQTAGWPGNNGYHELVYDHVASRVMLYGVVNASSSIYSTDIFTYATAANTWTHVGGNGSLGDDCTETGPTWPSNRHPYGQMAVDTSRNRVWLFGGVCQGTTRTDMYYLSLNATPTSDTWTKVTISTVPQTQVDSEMVYDPDDDVLFLFGTDQGAQTHDNYVYCPSSGSLTANQTAAGCSVANDWALVSIVGGVQPAGMRWGRIVYDTTHHKVWYYGGADGTGTVKNDLWTYSVPTKTWTQKCAGGCSSPPLYTGSSSPATFALGFVPSAGVLVYHQTFNTGAPKDWVYDPATDLWSTLTSSGSGPSSVDAVGIFDVSQNTLVTFSRNSGTGGTDIWQGVVQ